MRRVDWRELRGSSSCLLGTFTLSCIDYSVQHVIRPWWKQVGEKWNGGGRVLCSSCRERPFFVCCVNKRRKENKGRWDTSGTVTEASIFFGSSCGVMLMEKVNRAVRWAENKMSHWAFDWLVRLVILGFFIPTVYCKKWVRFMMRIFH